MLWYTWKYQYLVTISIGTKRFLPVRSRGLWVEGCDDRHENRVTVHTPTRRPPRHVRHENLRNENVTVLKMIALPIRLLLTRRMTKHCGNVQNLEILSDHVTKLLKREYNFIDLH